MNLGRDFPVIDNWNRATGKATSLKTLNLFEDTYSSPAILEETVKKYVDDLSQLRSNSGNTTYPVLEGVDRLGNPIDPVITKAAIMEKELLLAIPSHPGGVDSITPGVRALLAKVAEEAKAKGVVVRIVEIP